MKTGGSERTASIHLLVAFAFLWGLSEAALGLMLRAKCGRGMAGSLLTGTSMFFLAGALAGGARRRDLLLLPMVAAALKLLSALVPGSHLPMQAIWNPIYAYVIQTLAFIGLVALVGNGRIRTPVSGAAAGALAALVSAHLFPFAGVFTGLPACTAGAGTLPLSIQYAPAAVAAGACALPLGLRVGERLRAPRPIPAPAWLASLA